MTFRKYMHVERFGNDEVQGIEIGTCYIFPKLDGTNASVWLGPDDEVCCGSRNRQLSADNDNAGFMDHVTNNESITNFLKVYGDLRLYGEWLVPHSLKTYREDAWRKFYVFDVYHDREERHLSYDEYRPLLDEAGIDYIGPTAIIKNATYDCLLKELDKNTFLIADGRGVGEGVVLKNYAFVSRFDRVTWAKVVTNAFKEKHKEAMGVDERTGQKMVEQCIVDEYVTQHLVDKVYAKIANEMGGWNSRYIPRLLQTVYYDLINEECWSFIKGMKSPTINFKTLNTLAVMKIKECRPELF